MEEKGRGMTRSPRRVLYIVRGLPGSGKSTYAKSLVAPEAHLETDQYFMVNGQYKFDPTKIKEAHDDCLRRTKNVMVAGKNPSVAVSNTFTRMWEFVPFIDLAKSLGWDYKVIRCTGTFGSIHPVPVEAIQRMKERFESYPGEVIH